MREEVVKTLPTTGAILAAAFGSESRNIGAVNSAGPHHQMYFEGTPQSLIVAYDRENLRNLRAAATMLDSCIEQLQRRKRCNMGVGTTWHH
jgi:hypothetical protein